MYGITHSANTLKFMQKEVLDSKHDVQDHMQKESRLQKIKSKKVLDFKNHDLCEKGVRLQKWCLWQPEYPICTTKALMCFVSTSRAYLNHRSLWHTRTYIYQTTHPNFLVCLVVLHGLHPVQLLLQRHDLLFPLLAHELAQAIALLLPPPALFFFGNRILTSKQK